MFLQQTVPHCWVFDIDKNCTERVSATFHWRLQWMNTDCQLNKSVFLQMLVAACRVSFRTYIPTETSSLAASFPLFPCFSHVSSSAFHLELPRNAQGTDHLSNGWFMRFAKWVLKLWSLVQKDYKTNQSIKRTTIRNPLWKMRPWIKGFLKIGSQIHWQKLMSQDTICEPFLKRFLIWKGVPN